MEISLQEKHAYNLIRSFFDCYSISAAIRETESFVKASCTDDIWKKDAPAELLYLIEKLTVLIEAGFIFTSLSSYQDNFFIINTERHYPEHNIYSSKNFECIWNSFPRSLSKRQYQNPMKALKKFAMFLTKAEWYTTLKVFSEYALSKNDSSDEYSTGKILLIRLHLLRLIEASYLILIRQLNE